MASRSTQALASVGAVLLGAVLNRADIRASGYSYSYYYSGSEKRKRRMSGSVATLRNVIQRFKRSRALVPDKKASTYVSETNKAESEA